MRPKPPNLKNFVKKTTETSINNNQSNIMERDSYQPVRVSDMKKKFENS